jgi:hypothetical protein
MFQSYVLFPNYPYYSNAAKRNTKGRTELATPQLGSVRPFDNSFFKEIYRKNAPSELSLRLITNKGVTHGA